MNSSFELQREDFSSKRNLIQKVPLRSNVFQTIMESIAYEKHRSINILQTKTLSSLRRTEINLASPNTDFWDWSQAGPLQCHTSQKGTPKISEHFLHFTEQRINWKQHVNMEAA